MIWCKFINATMMLLLVASSAQAKVFESTEEKVNTIELFTSEGCSSCPPADAWLNKLRNDPRLWKEFVPMAFHVDYWDYLGWKDPWSSPEFTQRQKNYGQLWRTGTIYTPGMVLNGQEWRGWYGQKLSFPKTLKSGVLKAEITNTGALTVSFNAHNVNTPLLVHVTILGFDQTSDIKAGENRGERLVHQFNVMEYAQSTLELKDDVYSGTITLPQFDQYNNSQNALAVWVSAVDNPTPIQTVAGYL